MCRGWRLKWRSSDSENSTELPQNPENGTTGSASKPAAGDLPQRLRPRLRPRPSGDSRPARWSSAAHHGQDAEARGRPRSGRAGKGCDGTPPGRKEGRPATCSGRDEPGGQEATRGQPATEGRRRIVLRVRGKRARGLQCRPSRRVRAGALPCGAVPVADDTGRRARNSGRGAGLGLSVQDEEKKQQRLWSRVGVAGALRNAKPPAITSLTQPQRA